MHLIVTHLTRMTAGRICVAGLELPSAAHIRPVAPGGIPTEMLRAHGGPFALGSVVDLGPVENVGVPPEVEDRRCDLATVRASKQVDPNKFWSIVSHHSASTLAEIFGPSLESRSRERFIDRHQGAASLGHLAPNQSPEIYVNPWGKLRIVLPSEGGADLSVTDRRFVTEDHVTLKKDGVEIARERLKSGGNMILSVGLARAWCKPGDSEERHYLQVNNIHFEEDPLWECFG